MDFEKMLRRAWAIVTLDPEAIRATAADPQALLPGIIITLIGGALAGLGAGQFLLFPAAAAFAIAVVAIWTVILWGLGLLFGGKGDFVSHFRVFLHAQLTGWLGIVPVVGGAIGGIWSLIVAVVTLEELHGLTRPKAIAVVLIPVVLLAACCAALVAMFGLAILGGFGSGTHAN